MQVQGQVAYIMQGGERVLPAPHYFCMCINTAGITFVANDIPTTAEGDPNTFEGQITRTVTRRTWSQLGGIQIVSGQGTSEVVVRPLAGTTFAQQFSRYAKGRLTLTVTIENRFTRYVAHPCPGYAPTVVTTTWGSTHTYVIEIRKIFDMPDGAIINEISGPGCVTPGQQQLVTFSVAPWVSLLSTAGFDSYHWNFPTGTTQVHHSADRSSVTLRVGPNFNGGDISVRLGACNVRTQTLQTPLTLALQVRPGVPTLTHNGNGINFAGGLCLPFGAEQQTIRITNADPMLEYTWENLDGWEYSFNSSNHTLTFTPLNDARTIRLVVYGSCGEQTHNLEINRSLSTEVNQIVAVSGGTCVEANAITQFEVTGVADNTPITWAIVGEPNGWSIPNPSMPFIRTGHGSATVSATAGCGDATIMQKFGIGADIPAIFADERVCFTESEVTKTFSVFRPSPNTVFEWCFPRSEWGLVGADNQSTITLTMATSGKLRVRAYGGGCDDDDANAGWSDAIQIGFETQKPELYEIACVPAGMSGTITLAVSNISDGATYEWRIPAVFGEEIGHNSDFSEIEVYTLGNAGEFIIEVRALGVCGDSEWAEIDIVVSEVPYQVGTNVMDMWGIIMARMVAVGTDLLDFDRENMFFRWYVNGNFYSEGDGMFHLVFNFGSSLIESGRALAVITTPYGCQYRTSEISWGQSALMATMTRMPTQTPAPNSASAQLASIIEELKRGLEIMIVPNPANDVVTITLPEPTRSSILIINTNGQIVTRAQGNSADVRIDVSNIPNGMYVIFVEQNGRRYFEQLVIRR